MDFTKKNKNKEETICIVKLAALGICLLAFYNEIILKKTVVTVNGYYDVEIATIMVLSVAGAFLFWMFFSVNSFKIKNIHTLRDAETIIFIIIFASLIISSGAFTSQYKTMFIFIIITSTLQMGMGYGFGISIISSFIILCLDILFLPKTSINSYFQNDLILAGIFILIAWSLGRYVTIEHENIKNKDLELEELSRELNERKYIEEMLIKNEICYNTLIQNSRDAIFVQRHGKIVFANEGAARFLGYENPQELDGKSILDFSPKEEIEKVKQRFLDIQENKLPILIFDGKLVNKHNEIIDIKNKSIYFIYEGEPTILSIFSDITPEKQVQKLEMDVKETQEMNKMITEFFSNISHEFKTPLHVIFSATQLLSMYSKNNQEDFCKRQNEYLDVMKKNCYRLMRLINNVLDMSILDSGFFKLNLKNYNIVSIVEEVALSVAAFAESKNIELVFDTEVEEKVMAIDEDKIERSILNLLSNAIKFTESGGEIYVSIKDNGYSVAISTKDTGSGIPEDKLGEIFERFAKVDNTLRRDCEGAGIGLSLVKSLVEMHNGTIEVTSSVGQGSEFIIEIPVVVLPEECQIPKFELETNIEKINLELSDIYHTDTSG